MLRLLCDAQARTPLLAKYGIDPGALASALQHAVLKVKGSRGGSPPLHCAHPVLSQQAASRRSRDETSTAKQGRAGAVLSGQHCQRRPGCHHASCHAPDRAPRPLLQVVPMENVRGRERVEAGELCERKNGRGVDPNRNWAVHWGFKEKGAKAGGPCSGWGGRVLLAAGSKVLPSSSRPVGRRCDRPHGEPVALALTPMHPLADALSIHRCE